MVPFWVYIILAGIVISAYMVIKTSREERKLEMEEAEREGQVYLERMKKERERKRQTSVGM